MTEADWRSGYSKAPLARKLGIKPEQRIAVIAPPDGFVEHGIGNLPNGASLTETTDEPVDLAMVFVTELADLVRQLPYLERITAPHGAFRVGWPKRSSGVPTDVTEDLIREVALPRGLVDNKVCAINATWSGLRLSLRRELR